MPTELNLCFPDANHIIVRLGPDDDGSGQLDFASPIAEKDLRDMQWYVETYGAHSLGAPDDSEAKRIAGQFGRKRNLWEIERWFAGPTRRITLTGFGFSRRSPPVPAKLRRASSSLRRKPQCAKVEKIGRLWPPPSTAFSLANARKRPCAKVLAP
jgi:hypothetical protein